MRCELLVRDLHGPCGIQVHPTSREVYVVESEANRVSVIRDGNVVPVVTAGWTFKNTPPVWAVTDERTEADWMRPELQAPSAIAFYPDGRMLVTEAPPSSRILEFRPDSQGSYTEAKLLVVPWIDRPYAWKSISADDEGRLFVAGIVENAGPGLHFGTVLMRDDRHEWWVVDYGPFSGFTGIDLSRHQDILVVSDGAGGNITWWDLERRKVISSSEDPIPDAGFTRILPDGSIAVSQRIGEAGAASSATPVPNRIVRLNPESGTVEALASGFSDITGLAVDTGTGALLVADRSGSLYQLLPHRSWSETEYLLRRSLYTFEMSQGLPPKTWPRFMKDFVAKLGVQPTDEEEKEGEDPNEEKKTTFTVREFTDRIPLIAGRVKVVNTPLTEMQGEDPVSQLDFVVFYPGRAILEGQNATPSLSLFSAKRQSGRVEKTRVVEGFASSSYRYDRGWKNHSKTAQLYFPLASCTAQRSLEGVDINLAFLGMGFSEDYYLELQCGRNDKGRLMIDGRNGQLANFDVEFTEVDRRGQEVRNVVVAGFNPEPGAEYNWLRIGKSPVNSQLNLDDQVNWISYRMASMKPVFEQRETEWRLVRWENAEEREAAAPADAPAAEVPGPGRADLDSPAGLPPMPVQTRQDPDAQQVLLPVVPGSEGDVSEAEEEEDGVSWTNMILSRAIQAWTATEF